jgi:reverse gyrase
VKHSNADGEVEIVVLVRQLEDVGNDSSVRLVRRGELDKRGRAVTANNEDIRIDGQIFAVSAADIESYRSRGQLFEELFNNRPWLGEKVVRRVTRCYKLSSHTL